MVQTLDTSPDSTKQTVKNRLLRAAGVRRLHTVGCSRSGTTMLHYAFGAFENAILHDRETDVWSTPSLWHSIGLFFRCLPSRETSWFVTKREANWWRPERVQSLARTIEEHSLFLLQVVRDPRDVLTSRHSGAPERPYVTFEMWQKSVAAAEKLWALLGSYPEKLTVRYEDLVQDPISLQNRLTHDLGLRLKHGIESWARLKHSLEELGNIGQMVSYMHRLRDFDPSSAQRWQRSPADIEVVNAHLVDAQRAFRIHEFMRKHGYS